MSGSKTQNSRRAFFLQGGAVLGAGVATTVEAFSEKSVSQEEELQHMRRQLRGIEDREAIRQLHRAFISLIQQQCYEEVAELFDERAQLNLSGLSASGRPAIREVLATQYRNQSAAVLHRAYRHNISQHGDAIVLSESGLLAAATFHIEVELCTPLQSDCTAAAMARLQGNVADRRWEAGRFEAKYVKSAGQWRMATLSYLAT